MCILVLIQVGQINKHSTPSNSRLVPLHGELEYQLEQIKVITLKPTPDQRFQLEHMKE